MLDFKPPKQSNTIIQIAHQILPTITRFWQKISNVQIDQNSIDRLRSLEGKSCILMPNHTYYADALVMFWMSSFIDRQFYGLVGREIFEEPPPIIREIQGFFIQRFGGYSIFRGGVDRASFRTTSEILTAAEQPLVIFAEGGTSHQNRTVTPFENGVLQLCFWTLDQMKKKGDLGPLYAAPIGIRYSYDDDMTTVIDRTLSNLESAAGSLQFRQTSESNRSLEITDRIKQLADEILKKIETEFQVAPNKSASFFDRFSDLLEKMTSEIEKATNRQPQNGHSLRRRIRVSKNWIDSQVYRDVSKLTLYDRRIHQNQIAKLKPLYEDIRRLLNVIAISEASLGKTPDQDQILEVSDRLEKEVFGKAKIKGFRSATIRVGEPINLTDFHETYLNDKKGTVESITEMMQNSVQKIVTQLWNEIEKI